MPASAQLPVRRASSTPTARSPRRSAPLRSAHGITQTTQAHTAIRNEHAERELHNPGAWARATFGERSNRPAQREAWENGVRHAARYRAQYDITDPADALGPRPEQRGGQQRDWERAREAIERAERRIGREVLPARGIDLGVGL